MILLITPDSVTLSRSIRSGIFAYKKADHKARKYYVYPACHGKAVAISVDISTASAFPARLFLPKKRSMIHMLKKLKIYQKEFRT